MSSSDSTHNNVIPISRFGSTNNLVCNPAEEMNHRTKAADIPPAAMPELFSMSDEQAMKLHLQHCSAEINTAIQEGFYVHMLPPCIAPLQNEQGGVEDVAFCLQYEIAERDPKRELRIDLRNAIDKKRNPDYQPPQGVS